MSEQEKVIKNIQVELEKSRNEIKSFIEATEARLLMKIEELKYTVLELQKENKVLCEENEFLKQESIKRNIVVFGLNKKRVDITAEKLCRDLNGLLDTDLSEKDLSDFYPLGKTDNCPIKIEFISNLRKKAVMKNCPKLKGKGVTIANDLTQKQRAEIKILRKHLFLAKQEGKYKDCFIKGNKLNVNGIIYTADELERVDYQGRKPNSAPSTPITEKIGTLLDHPRQAPSTPKETTTRRPIQLIQTSNPVQDKKRLRSGK